MEEDDGEDDMVYTFEGEELEALITALRQTASKDDDVAEKILYKYFKARVEKTEENQGRRRRIGFIQ